MAGTSHEEKRGPYCETWENDLKWLKPGGDELGRVYCTIYNKPLMAKLSVMKKHSESSYHKLCKPKNNTKSVLHSFLEYITDFFL